jgi:hypothetical protein
MHDPYAPAGQYAAAPPRRSAIPKVIGILMIIFGSLGLLVAHRPVMPSTRRSTTCRPERLRAHQRDLRIVGLPVSAMQLFTGITCVKYKTIAPKLALIHGALAALLTITNAVVMFGFMKPAARCRDA